MKRLVAILIAFSFVLVVSAYAEAFRAPEPRPLPDHPRWICKPTIHLINQTFIHHMDFGWHYRELVQVTQLIPLYVPLYVPLESEKMEREDICIGDWAKKVRLK